MNLSAIIRGKWLACSMYFGIIKAKTLDKADFMETKGHCESKKERIRPLQIATARPWLLLCAMVFEEIAQVSIDDVDSESFDLEIMSGA